MNMRHISSPFDLKDENLDLFDGEARRLLLNVFPNTTGFTMGMHQ